MSLLLYAATTNPGKLAEFAARAAAEGINVLPLPGLKDLPEPVEDAVTFAGNAALKAVAYSQMRPGMLVLCDDSGIALDALGGEPGVRSARYADDADFEPGAGSKDERNNATPHRPQRAFPLRSGRCARWPGGPDGGGRSLRRVAQRSAWQ
jgi:XTP/dITP diphosphohydrolase